MKLRYYLLLTMFVPGLLWQLDAQSWKRKKADDYFEQYNYDKAIALYESLRDKDAQVYRNLARAYFVMGNKRKAADAYSRLISSGSYEPLDLYQYAYYLRMLGRYEESVEWMRKYAELAPDDSRARRFMEDPTYYKLLLDPDPDVKLRNVTVNGKFADFGPAFYKDKEVVFTSSRGFGRTWGGNVQPYLDLYVSPITEDYDLVEMKKFYGDVNEKYHDGPASFNERGDYMVLTRNIYGEKVKDNKLWLYESSEVNGKWTTPEPLHFNSKEYSCGHAALSKDGTKMYFVSDMPGGMGGTDLYYVEKSSEGEWGVPRHLGSVLNTEGNEMFPFYDEDEGLLFYASDGLPGLGGLDIFVAKLKEDGSFGDPVNVGSPVNTMDDDFALVYRGSNGFMSSNRPGGKGDDDIYSYKDLKKFKIFLQDYYLGGFVYNVLDGKPLGGAHVKIYKEGEPFKEFVTDSTGTFRYKVPLKDYRIEVDKEGYSRTVADVDTDDLISTPDLRVDLPLRPDKVYVTGDTTDVCSIKISPLYYDLDKYNIRPEYKGQLEELIALLKRHPEIKLEVASHTDCRASHAYNMRLSRNRTMSVIKYLTSRGIPRKQLVAKWYGETRLVNECRDGVKCTEAQHQLNRRTEFRILGCEKK